MKKVICKLCNKKKPHWHKGCNEPNEFRYKVDYEEVKGSNRKDGEYSVPEK